MPLLRDLVPQTLHTPRLRLSLFNRSPEHYSHLISLLETLAPALNIHTPSAFDTWTAESPLHDPRLPGGVQDQPLLYLAFSDGSFIGVIGLNNATLPSCRRIWAGRFCRLSRAKDMRPRAPRRY